MVGHILPSVQSNLKGSKCPFCNEYRAYPSEHINRMHKDEARAQNWIFCPDCDTVYLSLKQLESHYNRAHTAKSSKEPRSGAKWNKSFGGYPSDVFVNKSSIHTTENSATQIETKTGDALQLGKTKKRPTKPAEYSNSSFPSPENMIAAAAMNNDRIQRVNSDGNYNLSTPYKPLTADSEGNIRSGNDPNTFSLTKSYQPEVKLYECYVKKKRSEKVGEKMRENHNQEVTSTENKNQDLTNTTGTEQIDSKLEANEQHHTEEAGIVSDTKANLINNLSINEEKANHEVLQSSRAALTSDHSSFRQQDHNKKWNSPTEDKTYIDPIANPEMSKNIGESLPENKENLNDDHQNEIQESANTSVRKRTSVIPPAPEETDGKEMINEPKSKNSSIFRRNPGNKKRHLKSLSGSMASFSSEPEHLKNKVEPAAKKNETGPPNFNPNGPEQEIVPRDEENAQEKNILANGPKSACQSLTARENNVTLANAARRTPQPKIKKSEKQESLQKKVFMSKLSDNGQLLGPAKNGSIFTNQSQTARDNHVVKPHGNGSSILTDQKRLQDIRDNNVSVTRVENLADDKTTKQVLNMGVQTHPRQAEFTVNCRSGFEDTKQTISCPKNASLLNLSLPQTLTNQTKLKQNSSKFLGSSLPDGTLPQAPAKYNLKQNSRGLLNASLPNGNSQQAPFNHSKLKYNLPPLIDTRLQQVNLMLTPNNQNKLQKQSSGLICLNLPRETLQQTSFNQSQFNYNLPRLIDSRFQEGKLIQTPDNTKILEFIGTRLQNENLPHTPTHRNKLIPATVIQNKLHAKPSEFLHANMPNGSLPQTPIYQTKLKQNFPLLSDARLSNGNMPQTPVNQNKLNPKASEILDARFSNGNMQQTLTNQNKLFQTPVIQNKLLQTPANQKNLIQAPVNQKKLNPKPFEFVHTNLPNGSQPKEPLKQHKLNGLPKGRLPNENMLQSSTYQNKLFQTPVNQNKIYSKPLEFLGSSLPNGNLRQIPSNQSNLIQTPVQQSKLNLKHLGFLDSGLPNRIPLNAPTNQNNPFQTPVNQHKWHPKPSEFQNGRLLKLNMPYSQTKLIQTPVNENMLNLKSLQFLDSRLTNGNMQQTPSKQNKLIHTPAKQNKLISKPSESPNARLSNRNMPQTPSNQKKFIPTVADQSKLNPKPSESLDARLPNRNLPQTPINQIKMKQKLPELCDVFVPNKNVPQAPTNQSKLISKYPDLICSRLSNGNMPQTPINQNKMLQNLSDARLPDGNVPQTPVNQTMLKRNFSELLRARLSNENKRIRLSPVTSAVTSNVTIKKEICQDEDDDIEIIDLSPTKETKYTQGQDSGICLDDDSFCDSIRLVDFSRTDDDVIDFSRIDDDDISILSTTPSFSHSTPYNLRKNLHALNSSETSQVKDIKLEGNLLQFFGVGPKETLIIEEQEIELKINPDFFPFQGPYMCEICRTFVKTNREFVDHIKTRHEDQLDEQVLEIMETHLENNYEV